jgi:hypothetical protein
MLLLRAGVTKGKIALRGGTYSKAGFYGQIQRVRHAREDVRGRLPMDGHSPRVELTAHTPPSTTSPSSRPAVSPSRLSPGFNFRL